MALGGYILVGGVAERRCAGSGGRCALINSGRPRSGPSFSPVWAGFVRGSVAFLLALCFCSAVAGPVTVTVVATLGPPGAATLGTRGVGHCSGRADRLWADGVGHLLLYVHDYPVPARAAIEAFGVGILLTLTVRDRFGRLTAYQFGAVGVLLGGLALFVACSALAAAHARKGRLLLLFVILRMTGALWNGLIARFCVTGAGGFIGSHLVESLVRRARK